MSQSFLTPKDLAVMFGVSRATILNWENDRRLPCSAIASTGAKKGGFRYYNKNYIEAIFDELIPMQGNFWCVYPEFFWRYHKKKETLDPWVDAIVADDEDSL